jgi:hypothetical protein
MEYVKFKELSFYYSFYEKKSINYQNLTLKLEMVRFDLSNISFSDSIILTPYKVFYNRMIANWLSYKKWSIYDLLEDLSKCYDGEYLHANDEMNNLNMHILNEQMHKKTLQSTKFNKNKKPSDPDYRLMQEKMDPKQYFLLCHSVNRKKKSLKSRFCLLGTEYNWYMDLIDMAKKKKENCDYVFMAHSMSKNLEDNIKHNMSLVSVLDEYRSLVYSKTILRSDEELLTLKSDYTSIFSKYFLEDLTYNRLKFWEKTRHNLFGELICQLMNWESQANFDVNVCEKYNYFGKSYNKTPDLIIEMNDIVWIFDFAVTNANAGFIRDEKKKKYEDLRDGLSKHLKKEVKMDAFVWKINGDMEFQTPSEFMETRNMLNMNEVIQKLRELEIGFMMMKNYHKFKKMTDKEAEDDDEECQALSDVSDKLLMLLDQNLRFKKNLRSHTIEQSRMEGEPSEGKKMLMEDSTFIQDMQNFNKDFDEEKFENKLLETMEDMIRKKDMSKDMKMTLEFTVEDLKNKSEILLQENKDIRREFSKDSNNKISSVMKFPYLEFSAHNSDDMKVFNKVTPDFWDSVNVTDDGTYYYTSTMDFKEQKEMEDKKKLFEYNYSGIGLNPEEDHSMINMLMEFLMEENDEYMITKKKDYEDYPNKDKYLEELFKSKLWTYVTSIGDLMENLCYMESRRHIFDSNKGHTIFKNFGQYMILMKRGSKITQDKQIRYKIYTGKDMNRHFLPGLFKSWKDSDESNNLICTKWLAITLADIKHFIKIREVICGMFSNYRDRMLEDNRGSNFDFSIMTKSMMTQSLIMLEHRRGTSSSSQLNRYLLNSVTSYISNRPKLMEDIFSDPTRSRLEAYIKNRQVEWYLTNMESSEELWFNRIVNMASTSTDYDRFKLHSFYDSETKLEFSMLMDEIYSCNLFEKTSGFKSHRMKRIVEKMAVAEKHFQAVKMKDESKGIIKDMKGFLCSKDELHMFSRDFVVSATRKYFNNKLNYNKIRTAMIESLSSVVDNAMMMTSSLESGPYSSEMLTYSDEIKKNKSFITIYNSIKKLSTNCLVHMCDKLDFLDAIFTIFPKDQIGGAREILIQSIMLRLFVKYLETLSRLLCKNHEKEMLTKDKKKAEIQGDRMMDYKEMLKNLRRKGETSLYASFNSDATKWAPGFVMEHFAYFTSNWNLPSNMESMMLSVISAFSVKKCLIPESLKKKWGKKKNEDKEYLEGVQYTRDFSEKHWGTLLLNSGMGQGMLHFLSSFYHCIMDDYVEEILEKILYRVHSVQMHQTSLISSDDKTKMMIFIFRSGFKKADEVLKDYLKLLDWLFRLSNIHTNWKKSGLNFIITEFNSLFSVGKRMQWAVIKDIYNANSIPDMSSPEEAVVFMNSNIRRCLEHGVYYDTLKMMCWMARKQLMRYYRYTEATLEDLKKTLNCKEELLPYQLGFFPTEYIVESMLYGLEINMFNKKNSEELKKFYWNLYSHNPGENYKVSKKNVPFSEVCAGKYWYELPMKLDKQLSKIRNEFFNENLNMTSEELMEVSNHYKLNHNATNTDMRHFEVFSEEFFMGMRRKYEFQETMVVHSLIRALQASTAKGKRYPLTEKEEIIYDEYLVNKHNMMKKIYRNLDADKEIELNEKYKNQIKDLSFDITGFCHFIMKQNSQVSAVAMYEGLEEVLKIKDEIDLEMEDMQKTYKFTHSTMRTMRFYMNDIGLMSKKEEIIDFLFNKDTDFRSSTTTSIMKIAAGSGMDHSYDFHVNPFQTIRDMMNNPKFPNKVFSEYLTLNSKSMKFMKINMLSDLPCEGNMRLNLKNWYRTKISPMYYLTYKDNDFLREETSMNFLTSVSLNQPMNIINPPEHYYKISHSDNILMKSMKLHSISKGDWKNNEILTSDRVEYREMYNRLRDSTFKMWTNFDCLVKAEETKNNCYINFISSYNLNLTNKSDNLIMIIKRFLREMIEKGKKIIFISREESLLDLSIQYCIKPMVWKTELMKKMTYWRLKLKMSSNLNFQDDDKTDNLYNCEFNLFRDSYTVDSRVLLESEILDEYDDKIKVKELFMEIPDLITLDKIFMKNNWIQEIEMTEGEMADEKTKFNIRDVNASFGITSLDDTLSKLLTGSNSWNTMMKAKEEQNEDINSPSKIKDFDFKLPETSAMDSILKALKVVEDNEDNLLIEFHPYETNNIIKNVDYLVGQALPTQIQIYKDKMKDYAKYLRKSRKNMDNFHNLILWQVRKALDFEISNTMAIIIYNHILKLSSTMIQIKPVMDLKLYPEDLNIAEQFIFIRKMEQYNEDLEKLMNVLDSA